MISVPREKQFVIFTKSSARGRARRSSVQAFKDELEDHPETVPDYIV